MSKNINTLSVGLSGGQLSISGTADTEMLATQVIVYRENGTDVVTMESFAVNPDGTFSGIIALSDGNYIIKAADYDGGDFTSQALTTAISTGTTSTVTAPGTGVIATNDGSAATYTSFFAITAVLAIAVFAFAIHKIISRRKTQKAVK